MNSYRAELRNNRENYTDSKIGKNIADRKFSISERNSINHSKKDFLPLIGNQ